MWTINFSFGSAALSFFFIWPNFGPFCTFWAPPGYFLVLWGCFWSRGQIQKYYLEHTYEDNQLLFQKYSPSCLFIIQPNLGPFFCTFCAFRGYFWGCRQVQKNFLGPTYLDNQLWFQKYSPIFSFFIWTHFGPLLHFIGSFRFFFLAPWGYFRGRGQVQKHFGTYLYRQSTLFLEQTTFILEVQL